MKRKLYFDNKRFIQTNPNNNNIRDIETTLEQKKYLRYKSKEGYTNEIAKVYEINTHGKFTIIVRSSFLRLPIHSTTNINPCYSYDLSSKCDSEVFLQSDFNDNHYLVRDRKRKKWKSLHGKLVMKNKKSIEKDESSTFIVQSVMATTQNQNAYTQHSSVIIQQGHSYYSFFALLLIISIIILGFIIWYIFIKSSHSPKSIIRPVSENSDSDDSDDNNIDNYKTHLSSSQTNKTIDSLLFDDDNYLERNRSHNMTFSNNHGEIDYENIQMLIQNLQQSDLETINTCTVGQILSDLIHHAVNMNNSNLHASTDDLLTFLSYAPQFFHILRTIISNKYSCQSLDPTNFLQCQYLIDILHSSEFILEYLHRYHSHEKIFLLKILTHLYQILSSMNNNSYKYQSSRQSLFGILQELNRKQISSIK